MKTRYIVLEHLLDSLKYEQEYTILKKVYGVRYIPVISAITLDAEGRGRSLTIYE